MIWIYFVGTTNDDWLDWQTRLWFGNGGLLVDSNDCGLATKACQYSHGRMAYVRLDASGKSLSYPFGGMRISHITYLSSAVSKSTEHNTMIDQADSDTYKLQHIEPRRGVTHGRKHTSFQRISPTAPRTSTLHLESTREDQNSTLHRDVLNTLENLDDREYSKYEISEHGAIRQIDSFIEEK